ATPVVAGKRVYTLGTNGHLACLDLDKGTKVWAKDLAADYSIKAGFFGVGTTPIVEGKLLLLNVGSEDAGGAPFERETGRQVWKSTSQAASYSSPIAATVDGVRHVLFFTRDGLLSLDPANGKVRFTHRWRPRINESVNAAMPVLLGGDHVFLS